MPQLPQILSTPADQTLGSFQLPGLTITPELPQNEGLTIYDGSSWNILISQSNNSGNQPLNLVHILDGELNRSGKAVGFHYRPGGVDPAGAQLIQITKPVSSAGIYEGRVAVLNPATGQYVVKVPLSTFFPDNFTPDRVNIAIQNAFRNSGITKDGYFIGDSSFGFKVQGYYRKNSIVSAYPEYK